MISYAQATVKNVVEDEIMVYDFDFNTENKIMDYVFEQLNNTERLTITRQDIPDTHMKIQECWDMLASKFADYSLNGVIMVVESHIIRWCANKLKSMK